MKIIDLRSDTITHPTEEMRRAMYEAEVGDDVFGDDPTVKRLEELAAQTMGKEAAIYMPSGTMSNLAAILVWTHAGDEILIGDESHILWYELGGASALGGIVMRSITNKWDGTMSLEAIAQTIRPTYRMNPPTSLLCLENTHNRCSGAVLTAEYTASASKLAHEQGLHVHLDGARIFNAAVALNVPASELAAPADSVCFCVSKGLSAPVGSLLCGSRDFVQQARRKRQMLGGGMRQAGILAAAGIVAIQKMVSRLAEDHANAKRLACGLASIPGIVINPARIQTNIVMFEAPASIPGAEFAQKLEARGVRGTYRGGQKIRLVAHRMVNAGDIDEALQRIAALMKEYRAGH